MVVYSKIFKQAYEITKGYKYSWILGLFLITENIVLALSLNTEYTAKNQTQSVMLGVLGLALFIIFLRSKASIIIFVKAILDKQQTSLSKSFLVSRAFLFRILGSAILIELGLAIVILIIGLPIQYMFEHDYTYRAIMLLIPGLIIFIPVAVVGSLLGVLTPLFIVVYDLTIREAINRSFEMISKQWIVLIGFGLLLFIIGGSALFLGIFVIGLLSEVGLVAIILGSAIFLTLQSAVAVFQQTSWVLAFLDLVKPQKIEEAEPAIAPEIVS